MKTIKLHVLLHITIVNKNGIIDTHVRKIMLLKVKISPKISFFECQYLQKFAIYRFEILIIKNFYTDLCDVKISIFYYFIVSKL